MARPMNWDWEVAAGGGGAPDEDEEEEEEEVKSLRAWRAAALPIPVEVADSGWDGEVEGGKYWVWWRMASVVVVVVVEICRGK